MKFIYLHEFYPDNRSLKRLCLINPKMITCMNVVLPEEDDFCIGGTYIFMVDGRVIQVYESIESIEKLCESNTM